MASYVLSESVRCSGREQSDMADGPTGDDDGNKELSYHSGQHRPLILCLED
jgi:hypothetical protein